MGATRFLEAQHDAAHIGRAQPVRREASQHTGLVDPGRRSRAALAGDDDHQPIAARLRGAQERAQGVMRLGLIEPVQIERRIDAPPASEFAFQLAVQRRQRRRPDARGRRRLAARRNGGDQRGRRRIIACRAWPES